MPVRLAALSGQDCTREDGDCARDCGSHAATVAAPIAPSAWRREIGFMEPPRQGNGSSIAPGPGLADRSAPIELSLRTAVHVDGSGVLVDCDHALEVGRRELVQVPV